MGSMKNIISGKKGRYHKPENDYDINLEPVVINGLRKITRLNKEMAYAIYKLTEPITNRIYIGATSIEPSDRWQAGKGYKNNDELYYYITLAGWANIKKEIIAYAKDIKDAALIEKYFIDKYKSSNISFGYNINDGGDHLVKYSSSTRKKMSESHKGLKESIDTKRKKSNKVIAIKGDDLYICDSGKVLADFVNSSKDYVKNCLRKPCKLQEYQVFYYSKEKRDDIILKKVQNPYGKGMRYLEVSKYLDENLDESNGEISDNRYNIKYLIYADNKNGYEIK